MFRFKFEGAFICKYMYHVKAFINNFLLGARETVEGSQNILLSRGLSR